jgi:hypothetical protein
VLSSLDIAILQRRTIKVVFGIPLTLAGELVKGSDTLLYRDHKGNPVWDWRTCK